MFERSFSWIHRFCQFCQFLETHEKQISSIFMNGHLVYLILKFAIWNKNLPKNSQSHNDSFKFQKSMKMYFPTCLWISCSRIIVWTPSLPHFKCLGMRNLENEIRFCQIRNDNVSVVTVFLKQTLCAIVHTYLPIPKQLQIYLSIIIEEWRELGWIWDQRKKTYSKNNYFFNMTF